MTAKKDIKDLKKRGRKTDYLPVYAGIVFSMKMRGFDNSEICKVLRISEPTLKVWGKRYPEFLSALKQTKESTLEPIVRSLFDRATKVYEYDEIKTFGQTDADGNLKVTRVEKTHKKILPDTTAMIFLAKNIDKEHFRESRWLEGNINTHTTGEVVVIQLPDNGRAVAAIAVENEKANESTAEVSAEEG
ncbi:MAG: Phage terminase small subunit [Candidatus Gottesmanbacteria bacterium GW2011_GWB1_49_7]|uniref:Phage terminase small subunit n=1 Tax=Candidatus Gottesmanbacteria bacterium GW2011_GWB1_49_7 TaxID=1618448 RepID=A0A0G1Y5U7_9BACT|nr:MAG: Phage terminase small subunit [Candidatus Gottesmanbacteria bacterium GW2011_GWB1_49_7]